MSFTPEDGNDETAVTLEPELTMPEAVRMLAYDIRVTLFALYFLATAPSGVDPALTLVEAIEAANLLDNLQEVQYDVVSESDEEPEDETGFEY